MKSCCIYCLPGALWWNRIKFYIINDESQVEVICKLNGKEGVKYF